MDKDTKYPPDDPATNDGESVEESPPASKAALEEANRAPQNWENSPFPAFRIAHVKAGNKKTPEEGTRRASAQVDKNDSSSHESERETTETSTTPSDKLGRSQPNESSQEQENETNLPKKLDSSQVDETQETRDIPSDQNDSLDHSTSNETIQEKNDAASLTAESFFDDSSQMDAETIVTQPSETSFQMENFGFIDGKDMDEQVLDGTTVREKLASCSDALKSHPDQKMVVMGKRAKSISKIGRFVTSVIQSKGRKGYKEAPAYIHVCGAPGSGKTMAVKRICENAVEQASSLLEDWEERPIFTIMNSSSLQHHTKDNALSITLDKIGISSWDRTKISKGGDSESKNSAFILVLDEIDLLMKNSNSLGSSSGTEEFVEKLVGYASDENRRLTLIGISNTVSDKKQGRRLSNIGMVGLRLFVELNNRGKSFSVFSRLGLISVLAVKTE